MTYQELYLQHLEARLSEGGAQDVIERVVSEFNKPTPAGFGEWAAAMPWASCSTCGDAFSPESPSPNMEILCKTHAMKAP